MPRSTAQIAGHPLHVMLAPFPLVCFVLTLFSDLAYWKTAAMQWANMSAWLLVIGLVVAVFAVIAGLIDIIASRGVRSLRTVWIHTAGNAVVLVLAILDSFVHSRDAYTSVVPLGLLLSLLIVVIMVCTGWLDWDLGRRQGVGMEVESRS